MDCHDDGQGMNDTCNYYLGSSCTCSGVASICQSESELGRKEGRKLKAHGDNVVQIDTIHCCYQDMVANQLSDPPSPHAS